MATMIGSILGGAGTAAAGSAATGGAAGAGITSLLEGVGASQGLAQAVDQMGQSQVGQPSTPIPGQVGISDLFSPGWNVSRFQ